MANEATGTSLDEIAGSDEANLTLAKQVLGPLWGIADRTTGGYSMLVRQCAANKTDQTYACAILLSNAERVAKMGVLDIGRLHFQESEAKLRRVIELVGFARIIWNDPARLESWRRAQENPEAYSRYRVAFSSKHLKAMLRELDPLLPDALDHTSRIAHASLFSLAPSVEQTPNELRVHFQDQRGGNATPLVSTMLGALGIHLRAQTGFANVVFKASSWKRARAEAKEYYDPLVTSFAIEQSRWEPYVTKYLEDHPGRAVAEKWKGESGR